MRELERTAADSTDPGMAASADGRRAGAEPTGAATQAAAPKPLRIGIVGRGRVGGALARALTAAGYEIDGPTRRGEVPAGDAILLCVPDAEIETAAAAVAGSPAFVGHTSGATPLTALDPAGSAAFGLHPLQTIAGPDADLRGCGCAVAGTTPGALALAHRLARELEMEPVEIADEDRAAYHAAASVASNFLLTLEAAAESVAVGAGIAPADARRLLGPLVRATVENWLALGPEAALTGPVARGDQDTVAAQRAAVAGTAPELVPLFDELVERTRALAGSRRAEVAA
jgi:predicted short-subunit dehydrogenase-like oxidoreductase (DUF2520 family)